MPLKRCLTLALAWLVAAPPAWSAELARLQGQASLASRAPAAGVPLRLTNLESGVVTTLRPDADGRFGAGIAPGSYALEAAAPYSLAGGSRLVTAVAGVVAETAVVVSPAAPTPSALSVQTDPGGCLLADEHVEIDAVIQPAASVKQARVYFRSARESEWSYVEMAPEIGRYVACLPRPERDAGPIHYYIQAEEIAGATARSGEERALVIGAPPECPAPRRVATVCPCRVPVAVFGPSGAPTLPTGFGGAVGGLGGLPITTTATLVAIGAAGVGVLILLPGRDPASPSR